MHMPCLYVKYHGISQGTLLVEKSLAGVYIPERPPQEATPHAMIGISQTTFLSSQRILCWVIYATLSPLCIPANALVSSHSGQRGPCFVLWALRCGFATAHSYGAYSFFYGHRTHSHFYPSTPSPTTRPDPPALATSAPRFKLGPGR